MKWIVVAIIACIVPYTWLTLAYRKENPAHQPYQDNKDRAQVMRLLGSGFNRYDVSLELLVDPAVPPINSAETQLLDGGLPPLLRDLLIDQPTLPERLPFVSAPDSSLAGAPYVLTFACTQPEHDERPATATLYHRQDELVLVIDYEQLPDRLRTRELDATAQVSIPANTLTPGTYQISLLGARESRRWTFELL